MKALSTSNFQSVQWCSSVIDMDSFVGCETMGILISWLRHKPADLDLYSKKNDKVWAVCAYKDKYGNHCIYASVHKILVLNGVMHIKGRLWYQAMILYNFLPFQNGNFC